MSIQLAPNLDNSPVHCVSAYVLPLVQSDIYLVRHLSLSSPLSLHSQLHPRLSSKASSADAHGAYAHNFIATFESHTHTALWLGMKTISQRGRRLERDADGMEDLAAA